MASLSNDVAGKVVIVTGANAGIGLAITDQLLRHPSISLIVGVDVNTPGLDALLESNEDKLAVIQGDVSDRSTSQRAVESALNRRGRIDAIILNAGILRPVGPAAETAVEEWKRLFDVNFFGLVHTIQLAAPHLRRTRGQILMTSSGVSLRPYGSWIPYACSKAAVNWLCACLSQEEDALAVVCVTPGMVDTGQQAEARNEHGAHMPSEQYEWLSKMHAQGGLLRPDQPARSFVSLVVDGIPTELNGQVVAWDDRRIAARQ